MKTPALIFCLVLLTSVRIIRADLLVQPNDSLAITGDSITEQRTYSSVIEDYFLMCQPVQNLSIGNFGVGGVDAHFGLSDIQADVFPFKPTIVTTCYGMNDGHYTALTDDIANAYRTNQTALVEALKAHGVRTIIVGSPKPVDLDIFKKPDTPADVYNKNLGALAEIAKEVAAKEGVVYADVFDTFAAAAARAKAQYGPAYHMGGDGVHPGPDGGLVIAYTFLKAMGCDGNIGTITVDMGAKQATGTPGQEIVSFQDGTVTVKSTRYPYCFAGSVDRGDDDSQASMIHDLPFNEDLNRYLLVVKNLNAPKAKVTWGSATKEFSANQLSQGVNLAAEFAQDNPFKPQFAIVDNAVGVKEQQDQGLTQGLMLQAQYNKTFIAPGAEAAYDQVIAAGIAQHTKLFNDAVSKVVPVTHAIKIEPST
jgi:lysophospholipase L1-like esterase